jgi:hypothetical protein
MSEEMIERVARRLAAHKMRLQKDTLGERLPDDLWRQCIPEAQAALAAIRSQTPEQDQEDDGNE